MHNETDDGDITDEDGSVDVKNPNEPLKRKRCAIELSNLISINRTRCFDFVVQQRTYCIKFLISRFMWNAEKNTLYFRLYGLMTCEREVCQVLCEVSVFIEV